MDKNTIIQKISIISYIDDQEDMSKSRTIVYGELGRKIVGWAGSKTRALCCSSKRSKKKTCLISEH